MKSKRFFGSRVFAAPSYIKSSIMIGVFSAFTINSHSAEQDTSNLDTLEFQTNITELNSETTLPLCLPWQGCFWSTILNGLKSAGDFFTDTVYYTVTDLLNNVLNNSGQLIDIINKAVNYLSPSQFIEWTIQLFPENIASKLNLVYNVLNAIHLDELYDEIITSTQYDSYHITENGATYTPAHQIHKILTLNSYLFPKPGDDMLVAVKGKSESLMDKVNISIEERIARQSDIIKRENPDIILFQEVWGNANKKHMVQALKDTYPYFYYEKIAYTQRLVTFVQQAQSKGISYLLGELLKSGLGFSSSIPLESIKDLFDTDIQNPVRVRDGLIIMSKFPMLDAHSITFHEKLNDEKQSEKGAVIATLGIPENKLILVNIHLQSGRTQDAIRVRMNQLSEVGLQLKTAAQENVPIIMSGDMNEPINYNYRLNTLIDRSQYFVNMLNNTVGINYLNSNNMLEFMANHMTENNPVEYIAAINELGLAHNDMVQLKSPSDMELKGIDEIIVKQEVYDDLVGFASHTFGTFHVDDLVPAKVVNGHLNSEFQYRSAPDLGQMLDRMMTSSHIVFKDIKLYRPDFLGGEHNQTVPYNRNISDHTAVLFDIDIR